MDEQNQTSATVAPAPEKKSNLRNIIILVGAIILIFALSAGGYFIISNLKSSTTSTNENTVQENVEEEDVVIPPTEQASFTCAENKAIDASFYNEGELPSVRLVLSNGETISLITLYKVESGSGARYTNSDESMVFWNSGTTAFVEENGVETYSDCVQES